MSKKILVADDSLTIQKVVELAFSSEEVEVVKARTFEEAKQIFQDSPSMKEDCKLIIADCKLPGGMGITSFQELTKLADFVPTVLLKGSYDQVDKSDFEPYGYKFIIEKPFDSEQLVAMATRLMNLKNSTSHKPGAVVKNKIPSALTQNTQDQSEFIKQIPIVKPVHATEVSLKSRLSASNFQVAPAVTLERSKFKGRPAFDHDSKGSPSEPRRAAGTSQNASHNDNTQANISHPSYGKEFNPVKQTNSTSSVKTELRAMIREEVEKVFKEEFKMIATDVIRSQLKTLSKERSRFLMDQ